MSAATHPWTYIHPKCGKPAYHRIAIPAPSDPVIYTTSEHIDGRPMRPGDLFACDSCGFQLVENIWSAEDWAHNTDPANWRPRAEVEKA